MCEEELGRSLKEWSLRDGRTDAKDAASFFGGARVVPGRKWLGVCEGVLLSFFKGCRNYLAGKRPLFMACDLVMGRVERALFPSPRREGFPVAGERALLCG